MSVKSKSGNSEKILVVQHSNVNLTNFHLIECKDCLFYSYGNIKMSGVSVSGTGWYDSQNGICIYQCHSYIVYRSVTTNSTDNIVSIVHSFFCQFITVSTVFCKLDLSIKFYVIQVG